MRPSGPFGPEREVLVPMHKRLHKPSRLQYPSSLLYVYASIYRMRTVGSILLGPLYHMVYELCFDQYVLEIYSQRFPATDHPNTRSIRLRFNVVFVLCILIQIIPTD